MDQGIYISANSADQIMIAMQANNHNLANVNTTGYKADIEVFKSLPLVSDTLNTRVYTSNDETTSDFRSGTLIPTDRELDVAIAGDGWFAVQSEGGEAYTRRGDFKVSANGLLTTANNLPVLGNGGPISMPPSSKIEIGRDGTISIVPIGQEVESIVVLNRLKLVNPDVKDLQKSADGLFHYRGDVVPAIDNSINVISGSLESSNVNSVDALVNMLNLTRQYEIQMKLVQSLEKNDTSSAQIMQIE